jgi:hypothetical protein
MGGACSELQIAVKMKELDYPCACVQKSAQGIHVFGVLEQFVCRSS